MKIYFTSSITGLKKFRKNCKMISQILHKHDHEVCEDFLHVSKEEDIKKRDNSGELFKYIIEKIKNADIFIGDMSFRSGPVSYQLTYALENEKPTLYLYDEERGQQPHSVFLGNPSKYLTVKGYNNHNLEQVLLSFIESSHKLMTHRFNFILPRDLDQYIGIQAVKKNISKGELLRNLIIRHKKENEKN